MFFTLSYQSKSITNNYRIYAILPIIIYRLTRKKYCVTIKILMKLLKQIFSKWKKKSTITHADEKQKALLELGSQQFKKLIERGIRVPVVLL